MKSSKKIIALSLATIFSVQNIQAGVVEDSIKHVLGGNAVLANTTHSSQWKDPSSGITYYSGGHVTVRFKNNTGFPRWVDARAPSIKAGCDGFDMDAGFASIIDLDGITDQLSQAGTSMTGGFISSIAYSTPILGDIIEQVKAIADAISAVLQNACNLGKMAGSALRDKADKYLMIDDAEKYIKNQKESPDSAWNTVVTSNVAKFTSAANCLGNSTTGEAFAQCVSGSSEEKDLVQGLPIMISKKLKHELNLDSAGASPYFKTNIVSPYQKDFFVDKMPLDDYLTFNTNKKSKNKKFKPSPLLHDMGNSMARILLLIKKHPVLNDAACSQIKSTFESFDSINNDQMKNLLSGLKDIKKLKAKTIAEGTKELAIKTKTSKSVFNSSKDIYEFLTTGKVNGETLIVQNVDLYVVNTIEGETNSSHARSYNILCPNPEASPKFVDIPANPGLGALSDVEDEIQNIADGKPASAHNANIPIVMEAAKLAKALGKKEVLTQKGITVYAFSVTKRNIALANNYIILSKILDAVESANDYLNTSVGSGESSSQGEMGPLTESDAGLAKIRNLRNRYKEKLEQAFGTEKIFDALIRDSNEIEKRYSELKSKTLKKF